MSSSPAPSDRDAHAAASSQPELPGITVSVQGDDAMTGAVKAAAAMLDLLDAVTEEMAGADSGLRWRVASMDWRCDGCGLQVGVERPAEWTRDGSDDLCGECSARAES